MKLKIDSLIKAHSELTHQRTSSIPIVLMTRIRLARNVAGYTFPNQSDDSVREEVFRLCHDAIEKSDAMKAATTLRSGELSEL